MNNVLKDLRTARGLTQQQLAEVLGVSRQTVISIESGKYDPSLPLAFKIARYLETTIEEVFIPAEP
ncbi:MAG: helix-turn-helix transcriptional regulator [Rhodoferax sp.]|nr:helix-turn-helix transcriptional regulator [Rhodoferax sp.]